MTVSYREYVRAKACTGKLAWARPREAKRQARSAAWFNGEPRDAWDHYRCLFCNLDHIGHTWRSA